MKFLRLLGYEPSCPCLGRNAGRLRLLAWIRRLSPSSIFSQARRWMREDHLHPTQHPSTSPASQVLVPDSQRESFRYGCDRHERCRRDEGGDLIPRQVSITPAMMFRFGRGGADGIRRHGLLRHSPLQV